MSGAEPLVLGGEDRRPGSVAEALVGALAEEYGWNTEERAIQTQMAEMADWLDEDDRWFEIVHKAICEAELELRGAFPGAFAAEAVR